MKEEGHMRMAHRPNPGLHHLHALPGLPGGKHVLPDGIARARVVEPDRVSGVERLEPAQELERFLADVLPRPLGGRGRRRGELGDRKLVDDHEVVVARQAELARLPGEGHALVRLGAIAHQVAEAPGLVHALARHVLQHSSERGQVPMHVRDERHLPGGRAVALYSVRRMEGHRSRLPLAILGAVTAAGVATLLLRPRNGLIDPASVSTTAYFSPDELERARRFRRPQRALALGGAAGSGATLAVLALRPPAAVGTAFEWAERRPLAGSAATGAGVSLVLVAVGLPLSAVGHRRAV